MTEGELKKRTNDAGFKPFKSDSNWLATWNNVTFEIIDEAKKEFPCYPICDKYAQEMHGKNDKDTKCEDCFAWRKWIKKWFGDSK